MRLQNCRRWIAMGIRVLDAVFLLGFMVVFPLILAFQAVN